MLATLTCAATSLYRLAAMTTEAGFNRALGRRVKRRREERRLSQEALGSLIGLSRTSITNIEAGRQSVGAHTLGLLARHLAVPADELLGMNQPVPSGEVFPDITSPTERAFLGRALTTDGAIEAE